MVHGFGCMGEIKRARRVFDEMVAEGVLPSVVTYNASIQVLCKKDSVVILLWKYSYGHAFCLVIPGRIVLFCFGHPGKMYKF